MSDQKKQPACVSEDDLEAGELLASRENFKSNCPIIVPNGSCNESHAILCLEHPCRTAKCMEKLEPVVTFFDSGKSLFMPF